MAVAGTGGPAGAGARGQTGVDFLIGIGVFLLTVGFVIAFVPGIITPFVDGQAEPIVADRAADTIVDDFLAGPTPSVLDETCTLAFFGAASSGTCPFDAAKTTSETALPTELGISSSSTRHAARYRVNVTLERDVAGGPTRKVLCGTTANVHACANPPVDTRLAVGPTAPTDTDSVVAAIRVVAVDGTDAVLVVRIW